MDATRDPIIGDLSFKYNWEKDYSIRFFGEYVSVRLSVAGEIGVEIEDIQRTAFKCFDHQKDQLMEKAEGAIFNHYKSIVDEIREQVGPRFSDKIAPMLDEKSGLKEIVRPTTVYIGWPVKEESRVVGVLFTCSWEPELGLAVKFVDEAIAEVGPQDIVL